MKQNFENFEKLLASIDGDMQKIFEYQKEYIHCQKGCSLCCERGDYPVSRIEFDYMMIGFKLLEENLKTQIRKKAEIIKCKNAESYICPFLFEHACSVYKYRPFVCRLFGVLTKDAKGDPSYPFCCTNGLNYSEIYDKNTGHLSVDLAFSKNFKVLPHFFNLSNQVVLNLPLAKKLNIEFGETKRLIDFM